MATRLRSFAEASLMVFKLLPRDVAAMATGNHRIPLVSRQPPYRYAALYFLLCSAPAECERPGVPRIVQDAQGLTVSQFHPHHLSRARPRAKTPREQQPLLSKGFYGGRSRTGAAIGFQEQTKTLLHLLVGIRDDFTLRVIDQANRGCDP